MISYRRFLFKKRKSPSGNITRDKTSGIALSRGSERSLPLNNPPSDKHQRKTLISYSEALEKTLSYAKPMPCVSLPLVSACGHVSAETILAPIKIPTFNNSAMDGFALRSEDVLEASLKKPASLRVLIRIMAGDQLPNLSEQLKNTACEIMTGAPVPDGYDAVVRVEDIQLQTQDGKNEILIKSSLREGENLRKAAEDFKIGDVLVKPGDLIQSPQIMALAAAGIETISVRVKPKIAVFCTGNELMAHSEKELMQGKIYNSNGPYIQSMLSKLGSELCHYDTVDDDPAEFSNRIQKLLSSDAAPNVVLTTGGVSAGYCDFVPSALKEMGAEIVFHKIGIRPGKPILFAKLKDTLIVGLPGNPLATAVGLRFILYPLLRELLGLPKEQPIRARLSNKASKKKDFRFFYKASMCITKMAQIEVNILTGQESFKVKPLLEANCWAVLDENKNTYSPGELIEVYPLDPLLTMFSSEV